MGPEIATVPNISEGLVEISKKMMDLAAQLRAMAAQSAKPAAFIEEAEPLYRHAVALRSRGRVFKQHRWRQYLAVTLQPRGGGVTRGEVLMFPLPAAPSLGVATQPRPRRWDWQWCHRRWRPQQRRFPLQRRYNMVWAFGLQALFSGDAALFPQVEAHVPVMVGAELGDVRAARFAGATGRCGIHVSQWRRSCQPHVLVREVGGSTTAASLLAVWSPERKGDRVSALSQLG
uniref:Uncharacterized protein n=1 Tax=Oryza barthii TaxID=65489 RepID=A0A0D3FTL8_9ORYZ